MTPDPHPTLPPPPGHPAPHGPIHVTPDPLGWWVGCLLCQTTTLARNPDTLDAAVKAHQVEPDADWLQRIDRAKADLARAGVAV